jgi:hypothetical protein
MGREARNGALLARIAGMRNGLWRRNTDGKVRIFLLYIAIGTGQESVGNRIPGT